MITGQAGGRLVQLAITGGNLPDIWQALAGTGAAFVLRVVNSESFSGACWKSATIEHLVFPSSSQAPNPREMGAWHLCHPPARSPAGHRGQDGRAIARSCGLGCHSRHRTPQASPQAGDSPVTVVDWCLMDVYRYGSTGDRPRSTDPPRKCGERYVRGERGPVGARDPAHATPGLGREGLAGKEGSDQAIPVSR
jgi:hypothetical protein